MNGFRQLEDKNANKFLLFYCLLKMDEKKTKYSQNLHQIYTASKTNNVAGTLLSNPLSV